MPYLRLYWPWMPLGFGALALGWAALWLATLQAPWSVPVALDLVVPEVLQWQAWALVAPLVILAARRWPLAPASPRWRWGLHAALGVGAAGIVLGLDLALNAAYVTAAEAAGATLTGALAERLVRRVTNAVSFGLPLSVFVYAVLTAGTVALDALRRLRDEQRRSDALRAQLAEARLDALTMQLHPHFLFNTLNTISATLHTDPEAADRMLARLGDFLRLTLDHAHRQTVPLAEEVEFGRRYLEIERHRFEDRLGVRFDVAAGAEAASVPYLLLQPLVENAVRHGVARHRGPARIEVRAVREGDALVVDVVNSGPPASEAPASGAPASGQVTSGSGRGAATPGIGLANTRARLAQTFGDAASVELAPVDGGVRARVRMPFVRHQPHAGDGAADALPRLARA
ncbi:MAG: histidine kinase [Bacteroidota bacterium]